MDTPSSGILDVNDIRSVLRIVKKNWWILAGFVIVFFIAGYIYAYKLPDVYAAETKLLLKTNDTYYANSVISNNSSANFGYQTYINNSNEISVLQSFDLVKKVIDRLNIGVSYFIRGRLRTTEVYSGVPFSVHVQYISPSMYEKAIDFKIIDLHHYKISYTEGKETYSQNGTFGTYLVNTNLNINITTSAGITQSYANTLKDIDYLFSIHNPTGLVNRFQEGIVANNPSFSSVVEITLKDLIPARAIAFLDTLDKLYIQNTLESQFELNGNTLIYIDTELNQVTENLNQMEDTMQSYKERKSILDLDKEAEEYFKQYSSYDDQKSAVRLKIEALNDLEDYIHNPKDATFLPPSIYVNSDDPFLIKSAEELYTMQLGKNSLLVTSTPQNPSTQNLEKKIDSLKTNLITYINNSRTAFRQRLADVDTTMGYYIKKIKSIPEKQRGLLNIQRKVDVNEKLYEFLLEKRATTSIERAAIIPETKVIERARNMGIVEPKRSKYYYTYMAVGAVLALLIIFIRITFYDRIENIEELKLKTTLPILGEILSAPLVNDFSIAVEDNPKSPLTESFRTLRTNLQYMAIDTSSKVLLFTSNGPGEGKTFCSINMAAILAKAEKKVLLLEFDLHKPRINKALNLFSEKGLSTIIIGKSNIAECIIHTPVTGMDVILCGPIPPNSSELILSERVKDILTFGKEHYDYVIVDTPPLGLISDAFVLMRMSDINLFVLNTRFAYKDAISYVQETVLANKIKNFGFVLNNVKRKKSKYYYNRYNYGYYGGYGYGGYGSYGA